MESFNLMFDATDEVAREEFFSLSQSWGLRIPWNHPLVTPAMRTWYAAYRRKQGGINDLIRWPAPVARCPGDAEAIAMLALEIDASITRKQWYLATLESTVRAAVEADAQEKLVAMPDYPAYEPPPKKYIFDVSSAPHSWDSALRSQDPDYEGFQAVYGPQLRALEQRLRERREALEQRVRQEQIEAEERKRQREVADRATLAAAMAAAVTDPVDQARWADGTMPEREARGLLRAAMLTVIAGEADLPRYQRIDVDDLEPSPDNPEAVEFSVTDDYCGELTRIEWERLRDLRKRFAGSRWTLALREHRATWTDEQGNEHVFQRLSALAVTTVGPWGLSREYQLSDDVARV